MHVFPKKQTNNPLLKVPLIIKKLFQNSNWAILTALLDSYCTKLKKEVIWLAFHLICVSFYFYHWIEELGSFQGSLGLILTICIHWYEELSSSWFVSNLNTNVMISTWLDAALLIITDHRISFCPWVGGVWWRMSYRFVIQKSECFHSC